MQEVSSHHVISLSFRVHLSSFEKQTALQTNNLDTWNKKHVHTRAIWEKQSHAHTLARADELDYQIPANMSGNRGGRGRGGHRGGQPSGNFRGRGGLGGRGFHGGHGGFGGAAEPFRPYHYCGSQLTPNDITLCFPCRNPNIGAQAAAPTFSQAPPVPVQGIAPQVAVGARDWLSLQYERERLLRKERREREEREYQEEERERGERRKREREREEREYQERREQRERERREREERQEEEERKQLQESRARLDRLDREYEERGRERDRSPDRATYNNHYRQRSPIRRTDAPHHPNASRRRPVAEPCSHCIAVGKERVASTHSYHECYRVKIQARRAARNQFNSTAAFASNDVPTTQEQSLPRPPPPPQQQPASAFFRFAPDNVPQAGASTFNNATTVPPPPPPPQSNQQPFSFPQTSHSGTSSQQAPESPSSDWLQANLAAFSRYPEQLGNTPLQIAINFRARMQQGGVGPPHPAYAGPEFCRRVYQWIDARIAQLRGPGG